jgi:hypothetical protein
MYYIVIVPVRSQGGSLVVYKVKDPVLDTTTILRLVAQVSDVDVYCHL